MTAEKDLKGFRKEKGGEYKGEEVYGNGKKPARYAYRKKKIKHNGKIERERIGYNSNNKPAEVAIIPEPIKKKRSGR
jgi:hypothetical protein